MALAPGAADAVLGTSDGAALSLAISADDRQFARALQRMEAKTAGSLATIERLAGRLENRMARVEIAAPVNRQFDLIKRKADETGSAFDTLTAAGGRLRMMAGVALGTLGVGIGLNEIRQSIDAYTRVQNALKVAGLEGEALTKTYNELFAAAQRQGMPLEETAKLYGSITAAQKELGVSSQSIMTFTEGIGVALKVAGSNASQASGALLQLGQAIGGGVVRAEEFNSVLEQARPILVAVAAGMKEAGGSVATLRTMVNDGEVSSRAFFEAFLRGLPLLQQQASAAGDTSAQAFARIGNALINLVGELDKGTGASAAFASGANSVASGINRVAAAVPAAVEALKGYVAAVRSALTMGDAFQAGIAARVQSTREVQATQLEARLRDPGLLPHQRDGLQRQLATLRAQMDTTQRTPLPDSQGRAEMDREARRAAGLGALPTPAGKPKIDPISAADFPVQGKDKAGGGRGGGGGKSVDAYQRELEALNKRTAALRQEAETIGLSGREAAVAEATFRLMNAAKEAGIAVSGTTAERIRQEAAAYADAKTKVDELRESQRQSQQLQQFIGQSISGFFSDVISGGRNASDALMNLIRRLADAALQAALLGQGPLAGLFGTAAPQGQVGGLIGMFFKGAGSLFGLPTMHTGGLVGHDMGPGRMVSAAAIASAPRFHSGLTSREFAAVLERGEHVLTQRQAYRTASAIDGLARTGQPMAGGGNVTIVNQTGAPIGEAETQRDGNGDMTVIIKGLEQAIAGRAMQGRGPLKHVMRKSGALRG